MEICSEPYPDPTQFDPGSKYFDEKSSESDPRWHLVDVKFVRKFKNPVSREELKEHEDLLEMQLFKRNRLSITRVTESEYNKILKLAGLRSEEHTSELQSRGHLVCRLLLAKKKLR